MRNTSYRRTRPADARPDPHFGRVVILGGLLRKLLAINAHYEDRGERLVAIIAHAENCDRFEAGVTDAGRLFHVSCAWRFRAYTSTAGRRTYYGYYGSDGGQGLTALAAGCA